MAKTIPLADANALPDSDVVYELEAALELARSGELRTIAIVGDMTGGRTLTSLATTDMQRMIGLLSFLHHTICAQQRENPED